MKTSNLFITILIMITIILSFNSCTLNSSAQQKNEKYKDSIINVKTLSYQKENDTIFKKIIYITVDSSKESKIKRNEYLKKLQKLEKTDSIIKKQNETVDSLLKIK